MQLLQNESPTYLFAHPPATARIILAGLVLLMTISAVTAPTPLIRSADGDPGDSRLWDNVVDRMRDGQSYYTAMEIALRTTGDFPLRPFWAFRLPTLASFMSLFPTNLAPRVLLILLALGTTLLWLRFLLRIGGRVSLYIGSLLFTPLIGCAFLKVATSCHDVWAGILIALSLVFYHQNWKVSLVLGLTALSLREQVVPFVMVMGGLALFEKRWCEGIIWLMGLTLFAIYIALHAHLVSYHVTESDPVKNWTAFGGWPFVMATTRWTLPGICGLTYISGPLLPLSLLSLAVLQNPSGRRAAATMFAYLCSFMVVGNPDNDYWGLLYSALWAVGVAYSPIVLRDLTVKAVAGGNLRRDDDSAV